MKHSFRFASDILWLSNHLSSDVLVLFGEAWVQKRFSGSFIEGTTFPSMLVQVAELAEITGNPVLKELEQMGYVIEQYAEAANRQIVDAVQYAVSHENELNSFGIEWMKV